MAAPLHQSAARPDRFRWFFWGILLAEVWDFCVWFLMVFHLVGGIPTPLTNMKVSWDDYSQYMEKLNMFQTTSYGFIDVVHCLAIAFQWGFLLNTRI